MGEPRGIRARISVLVTSLCDGGIYEDAHCSLGDHRIYAMMLYSIVWAANTSWHMPMGVNALTATR